jgi:hypothetical protein
MAQQDRDALAEALTTVMHALELSPDEAFGPPRNGSAYDTTDTPGAFTTILEALDDYSGTDRWLPGERNGAVCDLMDHHNWEG